LRGSEAPDRLVVGTPDRDRELRRDVDRRPVPSGRGRGPMDIGHAPLDLLGRQDRGHPALRVLPGAAPYLGMVTPGIDRHGVLDRLRETLYVLEVHRAPPERGPALGEEQP